jgi:hypothetical protein
MPAPTLPSTVATNDRENGLTARQVQYAAATRGIEPDGWIRSARVYGPEAVRAIVAATRMTTSRKAPRRRVAGPRT